MLDIASPITSCAPYVSKSHLHLQVWRRPHSTGGQSLLMKVSKTFANPRNVGRRNSCELNARDRSPSDPKNLKGEETDTAQRETSFSSRHVGGTLGIPQ